MASSSRSWRMVRKCSSTCRALVCRARSAAGRCLLERIAGADVAQHAGHQDSEAAEQQEGCKELGRKSQRVGRSAAGDGSADIAYRIRDCPPWCVRRVRRIRARLGRSASPREPVPISHPSSSRRRGCRDRSSATRCDGRQGAARRRPFRTARATYEIECNRQGRSTDGIPAGKGAAAFQPVLFVF